MQRQVSVLNAEDDLLSLFTTTVVLTPTQQRVASRMLAAVDAGEMCLLQAGSGMGRTTVLRWLHARLGGIFVAARQWVAGRNKAEEMRDSIIFVDDVHLIDISGTARARWRNRFVFSTAEKLPRYPTTHAIKNFTTQDYATICRRYLGTATDRLDMNEIHRAAPALNAHQLKHACLWLGLRYEAPTTAAFLGCLQ
jgi:hypothetical protein